MHPSPPESNPDDAAEEPDGRPNALARRSFLQRSGALGLAAFATGFRTAPASATTATTATTGSARPTPGIIRRPTPVIPHAAPRAAATSSFTPVRPAATPLAVRSPYLSTWLAADNLTDTWPSFWNGRTTALCGIARVDGAAYLFCGVPVLPSGTTLNKMTQTSLNVTATQSTYTLAGGGVRLTVNFFSPVDPNNPQRQSVPFSYITVQAASTDGGSHSVQLYLDISGEWAHGDSSQQISWAHQTTGSLTALTVTPTNPTVLGEYHDQASWGTVVWATDTTAGLTWQAGQDSVVRANAVTRGSLPNTADTNQPRAIDNAWPVFGLNRDLGTVTPSNPSAQAVFCIGHVRTPAVSYQGASVNAWWTTYWSTWTDMLDWFRSDYPAALTSANALDAQINSAANNAVGAGTVGSQYAALCALSLRQAFGGTELVDYNGSPWALLKEISSDGNVSTADVIYPAFPAYLYLSPSYLQLLLLPILTYCESGLWPQTYCVHDLGSSYPNASGHNDGGGENMPIEESSNMLVMAAALVQRLPSNQAAAFATAHYRVLSQWANYLVSNTLEPGVQNTTDDFTSQVSNNVNLILKGIIGIGAMSIIASAAGNQNDQTSYLLTAQTYIGRWQSMAQDPHNPYLDVGYGAAGTWSLKYNGFSDRLLGLDLVPDAVHDQEANWYLSQAGNYGVIFDSRYGYTKADWELWTAGFLADRAGVRDMLISGVYGFVNTSPNRVPFSDWYVVNNAAQQGFQNRPVVGGMYSLLLTPTAPTYTGVWFKIQNLHSGKLLAVDGMSTADSANVTQYTDNGTPDHLWRLLDQGNGQLKIQNKFSGLLLAVNNMSTADGANIQQYHDNGTPDHLWQILDQGDGSVKLRNVNSGKVVAVNNQSTADAAQVTQWDDNGTPDHLWRFIPDGQVKAQNRNSSLLLAVNNMSTTDGANIQQYHDNGTPDHLWTFADAGGTYLTIHNVNSGKVVAVNNQSTADGAQVTQWDDNGTPDHLWRLLYDGGGYFRIQNQNSGKVLAVSNMSTADSANVTQYTDNGTPDHLWRFVN